MRFSDRAPGIGDLAELGFVSGKRFYKIAETAAWNFQQGAMLQWFEADFSIIANDFDGTKYVARVFGLNGSELDRYDAPFAALNLFSKYAVSVNFSRIYDFRKGYGLVM